MLLISIICDINDINANTYDQDMIIASFDDIKLNNGTVGVQFTFTPNVNMVSKFIFTFNFTAVFGLDKGSYFRHSSSINPGVWTSKNYDAYAKDLIYNTQGKKPMYFMEFYDFDIDAQDQNKELTVYFEWLIITPLYPWYNHDYCPPFINAYQGKGPYYHHYFYISDVHILNDTISASDSFPAKNQSVVTVYPFKFDVAYFCGCLNRWIGQSYQIQHLYCSSKDVVFSTYGRWNNYLSVTLTQHKNREYGIAIKYRFNEADSWTTWFDEDRINDPTIFNESLGKEFDNRRQVYMTWTINKGPDKASSASGKLHIKGAIMSYPPTAEPTTAPTMAPTIIQKIWQASFDHFGLWRSYQTTHSGVKTAYDNPRYIGPIDATNYTDLYLEYSFKCNYTDPNYSYGRICYGTRANCGHSMVTNVLGWLKGNTGPCITNPMEIIDYPNVTYLTYLPDHTSTLYLTFYGGWELVNAELYGAFRTKSPTSAPTPSPTDPSNAPSISPTIPTIDLKMSPTHIFLLFISSYFGQISNVGFDSHSEEFM